VVDIETMGFFTGKVGLTIARNGVELMLILVKKEDSIASIPGYTGALPVEPVYMGDLSCG